MTQRDRVLKVARRYDGVCAVDFQLPDVCDGGPPILRLAARLYELDEMGYVFECIGKRSKCKVFRLVSEQSVEADEKKLNTTTSEPEPLFERVKGQYGYGQEEAA